MANTTHAIHRIDRVPIELPSVILDNYSLMKLGDQRAARALARELVPRALVLMAETGERDWVLTSPPLRNIPCGANYMARHLFELLEGQPRSLSLHEIDRRRVETSPIYRHKINYAKLSERERMAWSEADEGPFLDPARFRGCALLFINDICVTGAKQRRMTPYFEAVASHIDWLYLLRVDPTLARREPEIEHRLNTDSWGTLDELVELLEADDMRYTGKCIATLLSFGRDELAAVMPRLGPKRRALLHELATIDGCWRCEELWPKLELLGGPG